MGGSQEEGLDSSSQAGGRCRAGRRSPRRGGGCACVLSSPFLLFHRHPACHGATGASLSYFVSVLIFFFFCSLASFAGPVRNTQLSFFFLFLLFLSPPRRGGRGPAPACLLCSSWCPAKAPEGTGALLAHALSACGRQVLSMLFALGRSSDGRCEAHTAGSIVRRSPSRGRHFRVSSRPCSAPSAAP